MRCNDLALYPHVMPSAYVYVYLNELSGFLLLENLNSAHGRGHELCRLCSMRPGIVLGYAIAQREHTLWYFMQSGPR